MSVVSRILAIIIMGAIALGLIAFPVGMLKTSLGMENPQSYALEISVPFLAVATLTIFIALWAPTARIAWGRLCVLNSLAAFALPLQGIIFSRLFGFHPGAACAAITAGLAFIGFFAGVIFLVAGYFVLRGAPRPGNNPRQAAGAVAPS